MTIPTEPPALPRRTYVLAVLIALAPTPVFLGLQALLGYSWPLFAGSFVAGCVGGWAAVTFVLRARRRAMPVFVHNPAFDNSLLTWSRFPDGLSDEEEK